MGRRRVSQGQQEKGSQANTEPLKNKTQPGDTGTLQVGTPDPTTDQPQSKAKKRTRTDEERRKDREKKRAQRALKKRAKEEWIRNGGKPEDWDPTWGSPKFTVKDLTARLDERLHGAPIAEPLKLAVLETAERHFTKNIDEIAKAAGISPQSVRRILGSDPSRLGRISAKREALALDDIKMVMMELASQLRQAVSEGRVEPSDKNIDRIAIAFGIFVDKAMLISGRATERLGYEEAMQGKSFKEQKDILLNSLQDAGKSLKVLTGGKQGQG